jgi:hypothetical protein
VLVDFTVHARDDDDRFRTITGEAAAMPKGRSRPGKQRRV